MKITMEVIMLGFGALIACGGAWMFDQFVQEYPQIIVPCIAGGVIGLLVGALRSAIMLSNVDPREDCTMSGEMDGTLLVLMTTFGGPGLIGIAIGVFFGLAFCTP